jgi:hypothetical protein
MITVDRHVGRLIELRVASPITSVELDSIHPQAARAMSEIDGLCVVCTDLLGAQVLDQAATSRVTAIIRQESPRVERNAYLVGKHAVFSMQVERMIRESGAANRKTFRVASHLVAWLGDALTVQERGRLDVFLREGARLRGDEGEA